MKKNSKCDTSKFIGSLLNEEWVGISEAPSKYEVSNFGRVRTLYREEKCGIEHYKIPVLMRGFITNHGYRAYMLRLNNRTCLRLEHRLIAKHFILNKDNLPYINHIDGNKLNNSIDNLEWCTQLHNVRHAFKNGLVKTARGEAAGKAKLTEAQVLEIFYSKENGVWLSKKYGVAHSAIYSIKNKTKWKHILSGLM